MAFRHRAPWERPGGQEDLASAPGRPGASWAAERRPGVAVPLAQHPGVPPRVPQPQVAAGQARELLLLRLPAAQLASLLPEAAARVVPALALVPLAGVPRRPSAQT